MADYSSEGERQTKDMEERHRQDADNTRANLEKQLSTKVKESSEFLNLKKMEESMAKQKMYIFVYEGTQKPIRFKPAYNN